MAELKGYSYSDISLRKLNKDKFVLSSELEKKVSREVLKKEMAEVLTNNGKVYFINRKKEVCGAVIIRFEKHLATEFELEEEKDSKPADMGSEIIEGAIKLEDKLQRKFRNEKSMAKYEEQKLTANAYVLAKNYLTDELQEKEKLIMFDVMDMLKEAAAMNDLCVKVLIWGDNIVADKTLGKTGGSDSSAIAIGMCLGMSIGVMFGLAFDNVGVGLCFGLAIGAAIGAGYYSSAKVKNFDKKPTEQEEEKDQ